METIDKRQDQQVLASPVKEILTGKVECGSNVIAQGWVRTRRDSKAGISFISVSDGSTITALQVIAASTLPNYTADVLRLSAGCSVRIAGKLVKSPAKGQSFEVQATSVEVLGWVEDPETYPISPKLHTLEYLREYAHLRSRTNIIGAIARVRESVAHAIHQFFYEQGFYWLPTPIITSSDCEGAGHTFRVSTLDLLHLAYTKDKKVDFSEDYFGRETFLTVSGQLNAECYAEALTKVYTFGPTFRAENSNTSRHLSEFWMVEPEFAFADIFANAKLAEDLLKYIFRMVLSECSDDMAFFKDRVEPKCIERLEHVIQSDFRILPYTEAIDILLRSNKKFEFPVHWGVDLQSEHERYLAEEWAKEPVVLIDYPKEIKAFYMRQNDNGKTVAAMDVLVPGVGEIIGGSQREERLDMLAKRMQEMNLAIENYDWYLDLRRYGTVPHSGFGMGFERALGYITGVSNLRDLIPFPRTPKHARY